MSISTDFKLKPFHTNYLPLSLLEGENDKQEEQEKSVEGIKKATSNQETTRPDIFSLVYSALIGVIDTQHNTMKQNVEVIGENIKSQINNIRLLSDPNLQMKIITPELRAKAPEPSGGIFSGTFWTRVANYYIHGDKYYGENLTEVNQELIKATTMQNNGVAQRRSNIEGRQTTLSNEANLQTRDLSVQSTTAQTLMENARNNRDTMTQLVVKASLSKD